jgi:excisionase family DNA binding protein
MHEPRGPFHFYAERRYAVGGVVSYARWRHPVTAEEYVSVDEAARLLGVSKRTLWRRIAAGELPTVKLGPHKTSPVRIRRDVLTGYIEFMKEPHADE